MRVLLLIALVSLVLLAVFRVLVEAHILVIDDVNALIRQYHGVDIVFLR